MAARWLSVGAGGALAVVVVGAVGAAAATVAAAACAGVCVKRPPNKQLPVHSFDMHSFMRL